MRSQCISRSRCTWSLPTTAMLFSAWQAMTHPLQPVQTLVSMTMAHACPVYWTGGYMVSSVFSLFVAAFCMKAGSCW